ncbi:hypothetical protein [Actinomyces ruminis]|uniref:hypothetical protein n=1 Tax=Actinomyces ruminis TaxID=1937003 RepID=UPI001178C2EB|nr:hypothetical protein [Actinomyces ruminis]
MTESFPLQPSPGAVLTGQAAAQQLTAMGLDADLLAESCHEGLQAAINQHTPFDPVIAFGFEHWAKTVSAVRKYLDICGWQAHDRANAPRSVSPEGLVAIAAMGGNANTGNPDKRPANARSRGPVFRNEVDDNAALSHIQLVHQLVLDLSEGVTTAAAAAARGISRRTWILLYYWDRSENVLRCELSLPVACDDGVITQWHTRIILPEAPLEPAGLEASHSEGPPTTSTLTWWRYNAHPSAIDSITICPSTPHVSRSPANAADCPG